MGDEDRRATECFLMPQSGRHKTDPASETRWEEKSDSQKLSSDLYKLTVPDRQTHTQIHREIDTHRDRHTETHTQNLKIIKQHF